MTVLILDDFDPTRLLTSNRRVHHMVRARTAAYWRQLGHDTVIAEYGVADIGETWHQRIHLTATFRFPDKRRRDCHTLVAHVLKPWVDGAVDARLLPDDDDWHLVGPDVRRDLTPGPHRIVLEVADLGLRGLIPEERP